jgi:iron complex outermembrane receptor protein
MIDSSRSHGWSLRTLLPVLIVSPLAAFAQTLAQTGVVSAPKDQLEEVTVTASRRPERLQDVPISVTAFTQQKLDAQGLTSIDDLSRLSPGVVFQRNGAASFANYNDENSDINIRGIDSTAGSSTVGIYIDDTPIQSRHIAFGSVSAFPAIFDLERVEVLRGPQGTLFGAGSEGGNVRFITAQPTLTDSSAYLKSELASTKDGAPSYELGAAAGAPLIDNVLGFRVSASFRQDGGYVDRVTYTPPHGLYAGEPGAADPSGAPTFLKDVYQNANWQQTTTFRAALKWAPNDTLIITPSYYYQELYINDTGSYWPNLSNSGSNTFLNGNALANPSTDPLSVEAIRVEANLGFAQLVSNTSYYQRNQHSQSDYTQYLGELYLGSAYRAPGDGGYASFEDNQRNFYQEVRLTSRDESARLKWNAGVFYSHQNENVPENFFDPTINAETNAAGLPQGFGVGCTPPTVPGNVSCPNGQLYASPYNRIIDKQAAVFGEASLKLTEVLKATVGVRMSQVDYTGSSSQAGAFAGTALTSPVTSSGSGSEKPVTPKAVLSYQPDRENLFYVSAAKGYRVGGINAQYGSVPTCQPGLQAIGLSNNPTSYTSDSLWSYELGAKNTLLDGRLQVNTSLYTIDWNNIQQAYFITSCGFEFDANLGKAQSRGGEIELQYKPMDPLLLDLSAAYMKAKYTKTDCANGVEFSGTNCGVIAGVAAGPLVSEGDALLGAPWTLLGSAEYDFLAVRRDERPYVRVDYQMTTAQSAHIPYQNPNNASFDTTQPGLPFTNNLSLRAGLRWGGFDVSLFGSNLTDRHTVMFESRDFPVGDEQYFARTIRPLTIGVTSTYRY